MLEGLEISEVNYSYLLENDVFRYDSFFFKKEFLKQEKQVRDLDFLTLKNADSSLLSFGAYSLNNYVTYYSEGIPFIRGINLKNGRIDLSDVIHIDETAHNLLHKSQIKPNTILLSMSGTIGDVALVTDNNNFPLNSNQDIAKIRVPNENLNIFVVYTFLLTKFGQNYLSREARGSVQQHVYLSQMENFEIPKFNDLFTENIETAIKNSESAWYVSQQTYLKAEELLLEELGLNNFQPSVEQTNIKSFSESFLASGRLDAEYYQPKYEDYLNKILNYSLGCESIRDHFLHSKKSIDRSQAYYHYTEISDINTSNGSITFNKVSLEDLPANGKMVLQKGDMIISKVRPYRGAIALIREEPDNYVGSGAFTVLAEKKDYKKEVLQVLLRTTPYQELMMKCNVGTSYPVIKDEDILSLPLPLVPKKMQLRIEALIGESFQLRKESDHLLEVAKRGLEIAIEQDEKTALKWMKEQQTQRK